MATDKETLQQVLSSLQNTELLCKDILHGREADVSRLAVLETKLDNLDDSVSQLLDVVRGNNGEGLQVKTKMQELRINNIENECKFRQKQHNALAKESLRGRWGLIIAMSSGLLGLAASLMAMAIS